MSSAPIVSSNLFHYNALRDIIDHDLPQGRQMPVILLDYSAPQEIGEFTVVTQAELTLADGSSTKVAVKAFRSDPNGELRERLLDELTRKQAELSAFSHENVCLWITAIMPETNAEIVVMPWFNNGNILEFQQNGNANVDRLKLVIQAARGLASLHTSGVVHGNFSPNNILIADDGTAVIVDDSLNILARQVIFSTQVPLQASSAFKSPEELFPTTDGVNVTTSQMDVYTFCSTVYSVYADQLDIFPGEFTLRNALRIRRLGHRNLLQRPALMPDLMWTLLRRGWHHNPANRPTMDEIVAELESLPTL